MVTTRGSSAGRRQLVVALGCAIALLTGCRGKPEPIRVNGGHLVVENQTHQEWRDVVVTVNAYYRGGAPSLAPGGRLETALGNFTTGLGQRFDTNRERVRRVEVRAKNASGEPVAIDWGADK